MNTQDRFTKASSYYKRGVRKIGIREIRVDPTYLEDFLVDPDRFDEEFEKLGLDDTF